MKVLILSSTDDPHAMSVIGHLTAMGIESDLFRFEEFIQHCRVSYTIGSPQKQLTFERDQGTTLDLYNYSGIWNRRPGNLVPGSFPEPWIAAMVEAEARSALDGMLYSLPCVWMNHPANDAICMHKLWQLELASRLGLAVPETLVTNQPELVKEFFHACKGEVIYKLVGEGSNFAVPAHETPRGVSTLPLRLEDLEHIEQVRHNPHIFQRNVQKSFELRCTIIGTKIFCIRIDSQAGRGKLDWRNDYSVAMDPFDLPADISAKCLDLMRQLGLNYGALDFIVTEDNQYVFLEINCAGQYMWIEQRNKFPISLEIARLLSGAVEPLVKPCAPPVMGNI